MTWVRLDDGFFRNGKARAAGKDGRALFLASCCYSSAALSDGFIPKGDLPILCADADVRPSVAKKLVEVGLWHLEEGGWSINGYLELNPSAEKVKADRAAAAERMRRKRSGERSGEQEGERSRGRSPSPVPAPSPGESKSPSSLTVVGGADDDVLRIATQLAEREAKRHNDIGDLGGWVRSRARSIVRDRGLELAELLQRGFTEGAVFDIASGKRRAPMAGCLPDCRFGEGSGWMHARGCSELEFESA